MKVKQPFLFNSEDFIRTQSFKTRLLFQHTDNEDNPKGHALFNLFIEGQTGISPFKAPFGSIEFSEEFTSKELDLFIQKIIIKAFDLELKQIRITSYPDCYDFDKSLKLKSSLLKNGFEQLWTDLNFHIEVDHIEFEDKIQKGERWKLRKSHKLGLELNLSNNPDFDQIYNLIKESRTRKEIELSLEKNEFKDMFNKLPEKYLIFSVNQAKDLAAVAVAVKVTDQILYVFYTADKLEYRKLSPVVMLHAGMYNYCKQNEIPILDLGTASKQGNLNLGVYNFKKHLGGVLSEKNTFIRLLKE